MGKKGNNSSKKKPIDKIKKGVMDGGNSVAKDIMKRNQKHNKIWKEMQKNK